MNKRGWIYFVALIATGAACVYARRADLTVVSGHDLVGLLAFVLVGVLSEGMALKFSVATSVGIKSSVSYLPLFACAVTFPPLWAGLAGVAISLTSDLFIKRLRAWVAAFNAALYLVGLIAAIEVYRVLGGATFSSGSPSVPAFFALAATYFVVNLLVVAGFVALRRQGSVLDILKEMTGPTGGNLLYDLLASPIALLAALLYDRLSISGIVLVLLPLILIRYSYAHVIQLKQVNRDLMRVLVKAIETRDPYTSGHSIRVSALARMIGSSLKMSKRKLDIVEQAGMLHDIGKIEAPYAEIISKPHELTARERAVIRTHPTQGADLLLQLSAFKVDEVVSGVRHHHEHYDGSGYPDGLQGVAIPLTARIIMICDALDAMLSDRPYRRALDAIAVKRELLRCSGDQFDPDLVRVVLETGIIERAQSLVQQEPPEAMIRAAPALVESGA